MPKPDNNTAPRERLIKVLREYHITSYEGLCEDEDDNYAADQVLALFQEHSTARVVDELKRLQAKSVQLKDEVTGIRVNAVTSDGHIKTRIRELESNTEERES